MQFSTIKLNSVNCWVNVYGVMPSSATSNMPIFEEIKYWDTVAPEWFILLSAEDKETISSMLYTKNNYEKRF